MGLSNRLHDASSDSIPILLAVAATGWVSYLRSLLLCLLHSLGLLCLHPSFAAADGPLFSAAGFGLAGLVVVASSERPFAYEALPSAAAEGEREHGEVRVGGSGGEQGEGEGEGGDIGGGGTEENGGGLGEYGGVAVEFGEVVGGGE
ncbi:glycine-rich protein DOT1-like [Phoenix dactylifera]|uniref:Glycine-rich protein DOT1-like n=1 Tax=Phoenix dactylifera TaxID=42345 RepID=A0A8B8ZU89_PHODC|nr:glycine-rich protein DOT1-like [Phoenix dactylifera]